MINIPKHIILSRTDSIGDVVLTLPLAGILKEKFPDAKITFLGNTYTKPIIACCPHVDDIIEWAVVSKLTLESQIQFFENLQADTIIHVFPRKEIAKLAKKAKIKNRIGTSHRSFHWLTCNEKVNFTRKNSPLHEAQLNTKLLSPFGINHSFTLAELYNLIDFRSSTILSQPIQNWLQTNRKKIILHPKSQGSAREWTIENYMQLAQELVNQNYRVYFTGTEKEGELFKHLIPKHNEIVDLTGQFQLSELIAFISKTDALVAASTGPLHIAGVLGITSIGLFSTKRPTHAGRWQPLGNNVIIIEEKNLLPDTQPLNIPLRDVLKALESKV